MKKTNSDVNPANSHFAASLRFHVCFSIHHKIMSELLMAIKKKEPVFMGGELKSFGGSEIVGPNPRP